MFLRLFISEEVFDLGLACDIKGAKHSPRTLLTKNNNPFELFLTITHSVLPQATACYSIMDDTKF